MDPAASVFVVDDDPHVRALLAAEMQSAGLACEQFASAEEFLAGLAGSECGCVLLDLRLSGMSGLELMETFKSRQIALPVILISAFADVPNAVAGMKLGAVDLIQKPFDHDELLAKVRAAIARDAARRKQLAEVDEARRRLARLTPRETELLHLLAEGKSSKMIARIMSLAPKTVENHRANLLAKTGANNMAHLVGMSVLAGSPRDSTSIR